MRDPAEPLIAATYAILPPNRSDIGITLAICLITRIRAKNIRSQDRAVFEILFYDRYFP